MHLYIDPFLHLWMSLSLSLCIYSMYLCIYEANPSPSSPFQSHPIHWIRFYSNLSFRVEISSPVDSVDSVDSVDNIFTFAREQRWFFQSMNLLRPAPMILARGHRANRGRCKAEAESRRVDLTNKIRWVFQQKYWYDGDLRSKIMQRDIEWHR